MKQKLDQMQSLAISLQVQLSTAQTELTESRTEKERLVRERAVEKQALQDALDAAIMERAENDAKWQRDFEQLRTLNSGERRRIASMGWRRNSNGRTNRHMRPHIFRSRRTFATGLRMEDQRNGACLQEADRRG